MLDILKGIGIPPAVVASLRGLVEAAILGGIAALSAELSVHDFGSAAWIAPLLLYGLRALEGIVDQVIDPTQNRA